MKFHSNFSPIYWLEKLIHQKQEIERLKHRLFSLDSLLFRSLIKAVKADERADVVKPIPKVETDQKEMTRTSSIVEEESTEGEQNPNFKEKIEDP